MNAANKLHDAMLQSTFELGANTPKFSARNANCLARNTHL